MFLGDVTEKKKIQREIIKIEKLQTVGTLAAGIAHDFNNILTGVYGNISLAKMFISNKEKLSYLLCKAEKSLDKAKALTSQLLTFSKGGVPVKSIASIESIIKDTVDFVLAGSDIEIILKEIRESDIAVRFGGEELLVVLKKT